MEDNLITLAIHTYEKALILKSLLENEGIESYIQNVNLIQPMVSSGVRIRIKESDLPRALHVVDRAKLSEGEDEWSSSDSEPFKLNRVLVPIDFSAYSQRAADVAIHFAAKAKSEVLFFHAYYVPIASGVLPIEVTFTGELFSGESLHIIQEKVQKDMENFVSTLKKRMAEGEIPLVKFKTIIQEGIPEEEIIRFSKNYKPAIIVMGTRGKNQHHDDFLGSVTAEVIDRIKIPVFAIPEASRISKIEDVRNFAFIAQFSQKDLISFDKLMRMNSDADFTVHFLHISNKIDQWDEVSLTGMQDYILKMYPKLKATYGIIDGRNVFSSMEDYIRKYDIDAIAMTVHKRNIFATLFHPSIANQMLFHTDTPILVMK